MDNRNLSFEDSIDVRMRANASDKRSTLRVNVAENEQRQQSAEPRGADLPMTPLSPLSAHGAPQQPAPSGIAGGSQGTAATPSNLEASEASKVPRDPKNPEAPQEPGVPKVPAGVNAGQGAPKVPEKPKESVSSAQPVPSDAPEVKRVSEAPPEPGAQGAHEHPSKATMQARDDVEILSEDDGSSASDLEIVSEMEVAQGVPRERVEVVYLAAPGSAPSSAPPVTARSNSHAQVTNQGPSGPAHVEVNRSVSEHAAPAPAFVQPYAQGPQPPYVASAPQQAPMPGPEMSSSFPPPQHLMAPMYGQPTLNAGPHMHPHSGTEMYQNWNSVPPPFNVSSQGAPPPRIVTLPGPNRSRPIQVEEYARTRFASPRTHEEIMNQVFRRPRDHQTVLPEPYVSTQTWAPQFPPTAPAQHPQTMNLIAPGFYHTPQDPSQQPNATVYIPPPAYTSFSPFTDVRGAPAQRQQHELRGLLPTHPPHYSNAPPPLYSQGHQGPTTPQFFSAPPNTVVPQGTPGFQVPMPAPRPLEFEDYMPTNPLARSLLVGQPARYQHPFTVQHREMVSSRDMIPIIAEKSSRSTTKRRKPKPGDKAETEADRKKTGRVSKKGTRTRLLHFTCQYCLACFGRRSDLGRHESIHTGKRPNICTVCSKAFIQRSALSVHLRTHTGEKPLVCPFCERPFSDSSSLARHRRIHLRPFLAQGIPLKEALRTALILKSKNENFDAAIAAHLAEKASTLTVCCSEDEDDSQKKDEDKHNKENEKA